MKHILLPIDGSTRSLRTIDTVKQTYSPDAVSVTILTVLPDYTPIDGQFDRERQERKTLGELDTFAKLLDGWTVDTAIVRGTPGLEIVENAKNHPTDVIVMTRSSRGPLHKLGSVATYLVRNAQFVDLIVLRENEEDEGA